jgi:GDP-L-fucose synthase
MNFDGLRAVVAGGAGFLGARMAERLRLLGADVRVCSRASGCDLRDLGQARAAMADARPDIVFNFAAHQGGIAYQQVCPATMFFDNVQIVVNTMEAARLAGARQYVNVIAACAYPGDPRDGVLREDEFEAGPMHESADNYGMSKRVAVMQAKHYRRQYGLRTTSLVLANCYGPRDHFSRTQSHGLAALLRRFVEAKREGSPRVEVWGRGIAERDWLFADDAIDGMLRALDRCPDVDLLNIATGRGTSTRLLAETIRDVLGYEGDIVYDATKPEGPLKKTLDVAKMGSLLDWMPPTSLSCGIEKTRDWLEANYETACVD